MTWPILVLLALGPIVLIAIVLAFGNSFFDIGRQPAGKIIQAAVLANVEITSVGPETGILNAL